MKIPSFESHVTGALSYVKGTAHLFHVVKNKMKGKDVAWEQDGEQPEVKLLIAGLCNYTW